MLRSFCVGMLAGYFLGFSKQGQSLRNRLENFIGDLPCHDTGKLDEAKKDRQGAKDQDKEKNSSNQLESSRSEDRQLSSAVEKKGNSLAGRQPGTAKEEAKSCQKDGLSSSQEEETKSARKRPQPKEEENAHSAKGEEEKASDPQASTKMQELADKLGAKPSVPEDDLSVIYKHPDDELKSA